MARIPATVFSGACGLLLLTVPLEEPRLAGYSDSAARAELEWETTFKGIPEPDSMRGYMQRLSARPHHLGSPYDKDNAEWILAKFRAWGLDARIDTFEVLFPTPKERIVELVAPTRYQAKLQEPAVPGDPTSSQEKEQLPTYNAYSIDGDVTAPLVFVNYGIPEDYERLERMGISVKGAIVIAKYLRSWRGIKPKLAAEHGAIGCLIYSDPADDGYHAGDVYPKGAYRPREGVQRGSVMDMPISPGDPLTPDVGATPGATRLPLSEVATLTKIPVLPLSYGDAQPLLEALGGPVAPRQWQGGLPITYHIGPGPAKVHLRVRANWNRVPLYDVIATIPGSVAPDEWVIRGNHYDAWVNGAEDPISGQGVLLEEARALGLLVRQGWRPRRTIIYCAWDGEEEGLLGSTEWVETNAEALDRHAVIYINTDGTGRGYLDVGGSHSLQRFINGVAQDVTDPEKGISLWKRQQLRRIARDSAGERAELRAGNDLRIAALGSGSDYTPFLQHLGIPALNLEFVGEEASANGVYHSIYDDLSWYTRFSDTSFVFARALAQTVGTAVMRFADAELIPYDFTGLANIVGRYADEVQKLLTDKQAEITERNKQIEEGVFTAIADPQAVSVPPPVEPIPPFLNFAPLENGVATLTRSAARYEQAVTDASQGGGTSLASPSISGVNTQLLGIERALTSASGLPSRPWFRHQIYAPGFYTGYGVKTLPGIREAIEQKRWPEAQQQIDQVGAALVATTSAIDRAAAELEGLVH